MRRRDFVTIDRTRSRPPRRGARIYTVGRSPEVVVSVLGSVRPDFISGDAPRADIVSVPGGSTWLQESAQEETPAFLRQAQADGSVLYSICSGALLLGQAGMFDGHTVTTNHQAATMLRQIAPEAVVVTGRPFVDDESVVTAAGAGTAIEATLHLIERFTNPAVADDLGRRYLDYPCMQERAGRQDRGRSARAPDERPPGPFSAGPGR